MINKKTKSRPAIIHCPGMNNPNNEKALECWRIFRSISKNAKSRQPADTEIVLCTNKVDSEAETCLKSCGMNYTILGRDIRDWRNAYKINLIFEHIKTCNSKQILYIDSFDSILVSDICICDKILSEKKCKMIFGSETEFYPRCPSLYEVEMFEKTISPNEYFALNSGCWVGETAFLRTILDDMVEIEIGISEHLKKNKGHIDERRITNSDQFRWHIAYKKHYPKIQLDHYCKLFQNICFHEKNNFCFKQFL